MGCAARANRSRRCPIPGHSKPVSWSTSTLLDRAPAWLRAIHTYPIACPKPRPTRSLVFCGELPQCKALLRDPPVCLATGRYSWTEDSAQLTVRLSNHWGRSKPRCRDIRQRSVRQLGIGHQEWTPANGPWRSFPERDSLRRASLPRVFDLRCRCWFRTIWRRVHRCRTTESHGKKTNDTRHRNGAGGLRFHLVRQKPKRIASTPLVRADRPDEGPPSSPNRPPAPPRGRYSRASSD